jgi:hypothetical protein
MVFRQRQANDFVFAGVAGMRGTVSRQGVDGDVRVAAQALCASVDAATADA